MSLRVVIESLQFYKLKSDKAVKIWLLLLILIRATVTMAPIGDRDFKFVENILSGQFLENNLLIFPTKGNLVIIALYILGTLLAICFGLLYSEVFILENELKRSDRIRFGSNDIFVVPINKAESREVNDVEKLKEYVKKTFVPSTFKRFKLDAASDEKTKVPYVRTALKDLVKFIPGLIFMMILLSMTLVISSAFLMIPFLVVLFILIFTPLNHMYSQNSLSRSVELSFAQTKGAKLSMFFAFVLQNFILNFASKISLFILVNHHYSFLVIDALIYAIRVLAMARLYALFYQMLALRQPYSLD